MASLPAAVDKLRRHLRGAIPDDGDLQLADSYLLDLLNSLHDAPDSDVGEPEGERRTASGETPSAGRTALDARFGYTSHGAVGRRQGGHRRF